MKKLTLFMSLLLLALVGIKANAATYTVAGSSDVLFGLAWDPSNTANDMTLQDDGSYTLVKENVALAKQDVEFKVCEDHGWSTAYPSNNYKLSIPETATYDVTFKFEPNNNNNVSATAVKKGSAQIETFYYLVGAFNSWGQKDENYKFTNEADGTHLLENVDLTAGGFKFMDSNGSWYGDGATVPAAGGQITVSGNNGDNNNLATGGNYTVLLDLNNNKAVFTLNEEEPLVIESMSVLGDEAVFGDNWVDHDMTQNGAIWTYTIESVVLPAGNYEYKARANHTWDSYQLPADGNNVLAIEEAGEYKIDFTANTENHTLTAAVEKLADPVISIAAVDLMGSSNEWAEPLASFTNGDASTGYWELNDVQFAANDEFKIRVSYSDQSEKWLVPVSDGNFLVNEDQLGQELTLTEEGGLNNMYVERNATLSFSLAPGFGTLVITGEIEPIPAVEITAVDLMGTSNEWAEPLASFVVGDASTGYWELNDVQFAANDEFKIRVSYSDQSEKWLVPVSDGNFLVNEDQLGQELTLTEEGGLNNMYVERNATLSFSLAPGFGTLVITGEIEPIPAVEITAVDLMGTSNEWAEPLASFVVGDASTGYWELNDVQFAANDEFKIRVSYSDQSEKWLVPVSDGNFLVDENQLGQELTLTDEGGLNNMYVEQDATLSFSLAPGFGALVITGEFVQPEPALTLHHGHDGQNDWQIVEFTYEDGIFTGTVALAEDEVFYFTNEAGAWFPTNENAGSVYELHSGWCTEIPLDGAGCQFFKMAEASTFTFIVQPFNEEYPQFDVEGWPAHDLEMYLYGNITDGGWENGTLMDVLEPNSHWLKYFTVEDVNNGNGYLKLGKAATFSDDTAIGAVDDADNYEVIAESADALRALQIPMVDGGKAIEIAAGYYAMHVWYNAETGEGRVQFDPQNVPIGKVEILVPDDGLVIEQGQTLQLEAVYTPQYTTNADLTISWLSSDPSIATVDENGLVTALVPEANGAPRRAPSKNADNTVTITASMENNDGSVIDGTIDITVSEPTGINDLVVDANVASVKYINAMGQMSDRAFDGLNIMVTTYIDGTTSTVKVVK